MMKLNRKMDDRQRQRVTEDLHYISCRRRASKPWRLLAPARRASVRSLAIAFARPTGDGEGHLSAVASPSPL